MYGVLIMEKRRGSAVSAPYCRSRHLLLANGQHNPHPGSQEAYFLRYTQGILVLRAGRLCDSLSVPLLTHLELSLLFVRPDRFRTEYPWVTINRVIRVRKIVLAQMHALILDLGATGSKWAVQIPSFVHSFPSILITSPLLHPH